MLERSLDLSAVVGYPVEEGEFTVPGRRGIDHDTDARAHEFRIGYLGRISPVKGVDVLLDAVEIVAQSHSVQVFVAGEHRDEYSRRLQKKSLRMTADVVWLGVVSPEQLAKRIDVAVVPSQWPEPFGRVAVELCRLGVPTVITPVGGLTEIVSLFPGVAVEANGTDAASLAEAIIAAREPQDWPEFRVKILTLFDQVMRVISGRDPDKLEASDRPDA
jgi:glycosyltransferase involved in cell wall biosynthesis